MSDGYSYTHTSFLWRQQQHNRDGWMDSPICRKDTDPSLWAFTGTSHPERAVRHPLSISLYFYLSPTHCDAIANKVPKASSPSAQKMVVNLFLDKNWKQHNNLLFSRFSISPKFFFCQWFRHVVVKNNRREYFSQFEFLEVISTSFYTQKSISFAFSRGKKMENEWDRKG